jgi:putative flavoprotein involved in K+ transport
MTAHRIHLVKTVDGIESIPTVIIGGSQAGLVMGYHLKNAGEQFVILDGQPRIGDAWRNRWDSLRLFTPAKYSSLPGWPMRLSTFPTHIEMGDYLEDYARHFELPVRCGVRVDRLSRSAEGFRLETSKGPLQAERVVIATGGYDVPTMPYFAAALAPEIIQLHSAAYRNPDQLKGNVLVVGAGNSGAEIALEAVRSGHQTWLAGRHPGQVPFRIEGRLGRALFPIVAFMFRRVLTLDTPIGRKARRNTLGHGKPLVRTKVSDLQAAGVQRIDRITGIREGRPVTEGGHVLEPQTVVWCTGYRPDYSWIELPITDSAGHAMNERGVSAEAGLYFIGAEFQYALASATIQGLDQDARYLMRVMAITQPNAQALPSRETAAA